VLEQAGISAFEESVLRVLLGCDRRTVTELAEELDAPQESVRRAVRRLLEAGVAERDGAAVSALDPLVALQSTVRRRHTELEQLTRTVDELSAAFHNRVARGTVSRLIEPVEGRAAIAAKLTDMLSRADLEALAFDTPPYAVVEYSDSDVEVDVLARKVRCRAVYAAEVLAVPQRAEAIRALVGLGEDARVVPHVPVKMMIVDRREALLPLGASDGGPPVNAVVVHKSEICDALVALFESVWARGVPLFKRHGESDTDLADTDHAILQLLNAGMTDDVIGRQLGISERTVRRRVSELAERVEAGSRFQIGAQAARRGWI
jgi:DNA-binding Lrp family transcriptional regulator